MLTIAEIKEGKGISAYLSGANFSGANFIGANLSDANLSGANLRGADFSGANLSDANLYGADLRGADLSGANLYGADLRGADLSGAYLRVADLSVADLSGADLSGAIWTDGTYWEDYITKTVPALLIAGGKTLKDVLSTGCWECRSWDNCPMHVAFGISQVEDGPTLLIPRIREFVQLFDQGLIPKPIVE